MPLIKQDGDSIIYPSENRFGLVVNQKDSLLVKSKFSQYRIINYTRMICTIERPRKLDY